MEVIICNYYCFKNGNCKINSSAPEINKMHPMLPLYSLSNKMEKAKSFFCLDFEHALTAGWSLNINQVANTCCVNRKVEDVENIFAGSA